MGVAQPLLSSVRRGEIAALDTQLGDMALYENNSDKAAQLARQRGELAKALENAEAEWLEASEIYESARV